MRTRYPHPRLFHPGNSRVRERRRCRRTAAIRSIRGCAAKPTPTGPCTSYLADDRVWYAVITGRDTSIRRHRPNERCTLVPARLDARSSPNSTRANLLAIYTRPRMKSVQGSHCKTSKILRRWRGYATIHLLSASSMTRTSRKIRLAIPFCPTDSESSAYEAFPFLPRASCRGKPQLALFARPS